MRTTTTQVDSQDTVQHTAESRESFVLKTAGGWILATFTHTPQGRVLFQSDHFPVPFVLAKQMCRALSLWLDEGAS